MVANDGNLHGDSYDGTSVDDEGIVNGSNGINGSNGVSGAGVTHGTNGINGINGTNATNGQPHPKSNALQDPIAVVGIACRLPGHSKNPKALWDFIQQGGIAPNEPPSSRFNIHGHYDGSQKPLTMRTPGGMFLEDIDLQAFDAQFFNTSRTDAIAMDPQQRQLLEIVYECLENAGVTLDQVNGAQIGCFVGSYAVDFADMAARDPEDRAESITIGIGRSILSNRISHFLNIKGPR
jgi:acyl transferase domain-containing protein